MKKDCAHLQVSFLTYFFMFPDLSGKEQYYNYIVWCVKATNDSK